MNRSYENSTPYHVAVIGAGPAGLFAARELAEKNVHVILFNRDIKPGGLAEYGIYPTKTRMKEGLRSQFRQILSSNEIEYYGNVTIGDQADLTMDDLRAFGFQAQLVTVGAQSTKRLGIPGEDLAGVYHAKDIVYHYNLLPPYSESPYPIGKRVAVVGVGNVMMDVTRWLINDKDVEQVVAIARRGPAEVKFDKKELESLVGYLDQDALNTEISRIQSKIQGAGQGADDFLEMVQVAAQKSEPVTRDARFSMRFLSSPANLISSDHGWVTELQVEENMLVVDQDGGSRAKGTGEYTSLEVDTVIFAIGDIVDSTIGLPVQRGEYAKHPQPRFPIEGVSYEAYDPQKDEAIPDVFFAGWARRASTGLVGIARKDATNAAQAIIEYLQTQAPVEAPVSEITRERIYRLGHPVVNKLDLEKLAEVERERARELGVETYKFGSNEAMLEVLAKKQTAGSR